MIEEHGVVVLEQAPTPPAVALWPKGQGCYVGYLAHCSPCVRVFRVVDGLGSEFAGEVDQLRSIGREIRTTLIDPSVKPCPVVERVTVRVPGNDLDPL